MPTSPYDTYANALRAVDLAAQRARDDERREADEASKRSADVERASSRIRSRAEALARERDAIALRLAELPITVPAANRQQPVASARPLELAVQLLRRAEELIGACGEDIAAIKRQEARIAEMSESQDARRRAAEIERQAREQEALQRAAGGDRTLVACAAAVALGALVAGIAGPPAAGPLAGLVLAAVATVVARSQTTTVVARIASRWTLAGGATPPPSGHALVAVFAAACTIAGAASVVAGLARSSVVGCALGGMVAALAVIGLLLVTNRPSGAERP
ncbi:MAG TPA: hypothetical protein VHZ75_03525 [Solirubrobacteraceae bacterium]|jgi:hypothetical protein|nr:hypothetical protein [Solirubrobacteraceae bacterium]